MTTYDQALAKMLELISRRVTAIVSVNGRTVVTAHGVLVRGVGAIPGTSAEAFDRDTLHLTIQDAGSATFTAFTISPSKVTKVVVDPKGVELRLDGWSLDLFEPIV